MSAVCAVAENCSKNITECSAAGSKVSCSMCASKCSTLELSGKVSRLMIMLGFSVTTLCKLGMHCYRHHFIIANFRIICLIVLKVF